MFSFLLGAGSAFILAIYQPQVFVYLKEQIIGLFTKAGIDTPVSAESKIKSDEE